MTFIIIKHYRKYPPRKLLNCSKINNEKKKEIKNQDL